MNSSLLINNGLLIMHVLSFIQFDKFSLKNSFYVMNVGTMKQIFFKNF
jgi:hypothetical protein